MRSANAKQRRLVRSTVRAVCETLDRQLFLAAGDLDPTFSGNGLATIGTSALSAVDVAVQSSGKTIVVGESTSGKITVARFTTDGVLDTTFGPSGTGTVFADYTDLNPNFTFVNTAAVAIQPADDKIVVVGTCSGVLAVTRFTADGALDPTFSGDGRLPSTVLGLGLVDHFGEDVAIQADGRIVVAATVVSPGSDIDMGVVRILTNGNEDNSFSGDGAVVIGFGEDEFADALTIDSSGRIVVVGHSLDSNSVVQFAIARLNVFGSLDGSFSGDGKVLSRFTGSTLYSSARGVVAQPDGKLVIVGEVGSDNSNDHNTGLFRLNANGTGDPTFGVGNGQTVIDFGGGDQVSSMIAGQTGRLLVGGTKPYASTPGNPQGLMTIACLSSNGLLDPVFGGGDGKVELAFDANFSLAAAHGLALAPDGKFVAAGGRNFATARLFDRRFRTVSIGNFQPQMYEQGQQGTSFLIGLLEPQPTITRVFLGTGGQATPPATLPPRPRDYNGSAEISFGNGQTSSTFVDIPAGATFVNVVITPVDDATVEGDELATFSIAPNAAYDAAPPSVTTLVVRDNDTAVPSVNASAFLFETGPQRLTFRFTQDVGASLTAGDFQVTGATGIPAHTTTYDAVTNTATLSFPTHLPDGNLTARVVGAGITNPAGTPMAADSLFQFFFLSGDANRDRIVDIGDFSVLAARFNLPGTFSQGDFNYDGITDIGDFSILASKFNTSLPAPFSRTASAPPLAQSPPQPLRTARDDARRDRHNLGLIADGQSLVL